MRACFPAFQPEQKYLRVTKVNYFTVSIVYTWQHKNLLVLEKISYATVIQIVEFKLQLFSVILSYFSCLLFVAIIFVYARTAH